VALYPFALAEAALQHVAGLVIAAAHVRQWAELPAEAPSPTALVRGLALGTLVLCCFALVCEARSLAVLSRRVSAPENPKAKPQGVQPNQVVGGGRDGGTV
jgi:hypothetical protein